MDAERIAAALVKVISDEASFMGNGYSDNIDSYALSQMLDRIAYNFEKLLEKESGHGR